MASESFVKAAVKEREALLRQIDNLRSEVQALTMIINRSEIGANLKSVGQQLSFSIKQGTRSLKDLGYDIEVYSGGSKRILTAKTTSITWKDYLFEAIVALGGEAKVSEIAQSVVLSNKNITMTRVKNAANDKLPELVKEGKLEVVGSPSRKEGYTYKIKESEADASE